MLIRGGERPSPGEVLTVPDLAGPLPRLRLLAVTLPCVAVVALTVLRHTVVADRWPAHGHLLLDGFLTIATAVFAVAMAATVEQRHRQVVQRSLDLAAIETVAAAARRAHTPDDVAHSCLRAVLDATGAASARLDALDRLDPESDTTTWQFDDHPAATGAPGRTLPLTCADDPLGTLTIVGEDAVAHPLTDAAHAGIATTVASALHRARHLAHLHHECHDAALAERDRIAREMHDSLAQALGAAHLRIHAISAHPDLATSPDVADELDDVASLCEEAYADVREAILGLRTSAAPTHTLTQALEGYLAAWSRRAGVPARLDVETDSADALPPHDQNHVLRVVQEALTNVRKHAGAGCVEVRIGHGRSRTHVTIVDDGCGFDPADPTEDRYGLATMTERAHLLDGTLAVDSAPGHGTRITLDLPTPPPAPHPYVPTPERTADASMSTSTMSTSTMSTTTPRATTIPGTRHAHARATS